MQQVVRISHMTKHYPGVVALDDVQLEVQPGEVHALLGENGAGKSTLIKILAGVAEPDGGTIELAGKEVSFKHPLEAVVNGIAVTYQDLSLFPNLSVAENIAISKKLETGDFHVTWGEIRRIAQEALDELGVEVDVSARLGYLSIGTQTLVAIARAIVHDAKLMILDEPTASLAREEIRALFRVIRLLRDRGLGILFVSHKLDEVYQISDRLTVLRDGRYVGTFQTQSLPEEELISHMVGRPVRFTRYPSREADQTLLSVRGLSKRHNFEDINFELRRGEILGFTGLVGAGRSELMQSLFGTNRPDAGEIWIDGEKVHISSSHEAMKLGIAYIPESRHEMGLILGKSLSENVSVTILDRIVNKLRLINENDRQSRVKKWIDQLNIKPNFPHMLIDQFSGGNQQKAVIAKWLAYEPKLLIVDEPTHGIDVGAKAEIHKLLRELSDQGIGVIVVSSELPEVIAISDRIEVMRRGRIVGEFVGDNVEQEQIMNLAITKRSTAGAQAAMTQDNPAEEQAGQEPAAQKQHAEQPE
jgi:ABC-type sugar transport system ATPase subunit